MKTIENLIYKKASDINQEYPILEVYRDQLHEMIIDVEITRNKVLKINFYNCNGGLSLEISLLKELITNAEEFYNHEVNNP